MSTRAVVTLIALVLSAVSSRAQQGARAEPRLRAARRAELDAGLAGAPQPQRQQLRRQLLEQQLRRGLWRVAKQRIGFDDGQMTRLESTSQRFDVRRKALGQQERAERLALRSEILADSAADQRRVAAALDRLHDLQRQRLDLQAEEQREYATFMSPLQRAKYAALQEQVRRRVEALRRQRPDSAPPLLNEP